MHLNPETGYDLLEVQNKMKLIYELDLHSVERVELEDLHGLDLVLDQARVHDGADGQLLERSNGWQFSIAKP